MNPLKHLAGMVHDASTDVDRMIQEAARAFSALSPDEQRAHREAQRREWVIAEARFGSDKDEADYAAVMDRGDEAEIARLDAEADQRAELARQYLDGKLL